MTVTVPYEKQLKSHCAVGGKRIKTTGEEY